MNELYEEVGVYIVTDVMAWSTLKGGIATSFSSMYLIGTGDGNRDE